MSDVFMVKCILGESLSDNERNSKWQMKILIVLKHVSSQDI